MSTDEHVIEESMDAEEALLPQNIVDCVDFGRRLRALRVLNKFDRVSDLAAMLRSNYGVDVSARTVYAIERGEQMPHIDFFLAVQHLLHAAPNYFAPAIRADVIEGIIKDSRR